jgi:Flp pilus assembly protein TadD
MSTKSSQSRLRRWLAGLGLVVLAALAGWGACWWQHGRSSPDMVAVLHANNLGVGHMEQFNYAKAVTEFEKVVQLAPDWLPGRINLGIALLNWNTGGSLDRAIALFQDILRQEPKNPYAHFCLGIIFDHSGRTDEAIPHYEAVTQIDPNDAAAWCRLGNLLPDDTRAIECLRRARQLDPYLVAATYGLAMKLRQQDLEKAKALLDEQKLLTEAGWENPNAIKYTEMGRYAEVIGQVADRHSGPRPGPIPLFGREGKFQVQLAPGTRWGTAADFGQGPVADLRARLRARFGGTVVVVDYDRDDKPDLFLLGAVVEAGEVRDLLLHNDGTGHFTDVTAQAGLGGARPSLGCCVADYDNDGYPDLLITGVGAQRLFRNTGAGRFEDVTNQGNETPPAGLDQLHTVCLGAVFVDLDQDGDLDLLVAQYAASPETALAALESPEPKGAGAKPGAGLAVYLNRGEAVASARPNKTPPLKTAFRRLTEPVELVGPSIPTVAVAVADWDWDRDLDLFPLADGRAPALVLNDRLLRFHSTSLPEALLGARRWNGALVCDANHDSRSDLLVIGPEQPPVLLLTRPTEDRAEVGQWFQAGATNSPPLLQAQAIDLDLDGWTDVVGLSAQRKPVFLHNEGGRLALAAEALGPEADWPPDLAGVTARDVDGDGDLDLLLWAEKTGLHLRANQGNGNWGLKLELTGQSGIKDERGNKLRCNADGFGVWAVAQAADLWTGAENTTLSAGLGQSRQPLVLGLGRRTLAEVVRLRWPDNTWQAEFNLPTNQIVRIEETNRKTGSCPILFAWNGRRFGFVTDFLGAGTVGEMQAGGGSRPARPEEAVKIEASQLVPLDGQYVLKVADPMDEVTYLDRLQLLVLDHPADVHVYPDERFGASRPLADQELFAFRQEVFPVRARDHRGRDVTQTLRAWDRDTADSFYRRSWLGLAEEHWVELDFGDRLAGFGPQDRLVLCLAGWTDYAYPESIWAATQAGVALQTPVLERRASDGSWQPLVADVGFPAGLPRMMTLDVTGKLGGPRCVVRLRTNLDIYWDQIFVAPVLETVAPHPWPLSPEGRGEKDSGIVRATPLEVSGATLAARGCVQEYSPDGRQPTLYNYDRLDAQPVVKLSGYLTRLGDVTKLLRETDDRFVLFGAGDEVTVRFDAGRLPELPAGWTRSFVLRTWGYCKDAAPFTATGDTVEPLPFRGMRGYPYGPDEKYPHEDDQRQYNTRWVGPARPTAPSKR